MAFGQVVSERQAPLVPQDYSITGTAFLEELANGDLQLRLSDDFDTPAGPDVRIFLGNSLSLSGAVEIANLADLGHFSGAITFDVPSGISIDEFDFVLFYCVLFQQFWASGELGEINNLGFECLDSEVNNANGSNTINICPSDGVDDVIEFENSLGESAGSNYVYLITNAGQVLEEVVTEDEYNFEGSSDDQQRVYGLHFDGMLDVKIGSHRTETTASGCHTHSDNSDYITILKEACVECEESSVENANGNNQLNICPTDGSDDIIEFENSLNLDAGSNYAYLITDSDQILEEVLFSNEYNFEGSGPNAQRVYGVHYEGNLNIAIGENRKETVADLCTQHSNDDEYISILKNACIAPIICVESITSTMDSIYMIDICPNDNLPDSIYFNNSIKDLNNTNYAYLITDTSQVVQAVVLDSVYNFEGSSLEEQRVYGVNYSGILNSIVGEHRFQTTASECYTHSHVDSFLTVTKLACPPNFICLESQTQLSNGNQQINICPTDNQSDVVEFSNSLNIPGGNNYTYLITDENEILQSVVTNSSYDFESTTLETQLVFGIHHEGMLIPIIGQHRLQTTAMGCFEHSSNDIFITIIKDACLPEFECESSLTATTNWASEVNICPTDGNDDIIELRNNLFVSPGEHYAYLITDENEVLQAVTLDSTYNFEGSSTETQRVYGIHFDGVLDIRIGENRKMTTASGCYEHSGDNLFLTIRKEACEDVFECQASLTATTNWATEVNICPSDGNSDIVELRNNLFIQPGEHYAYLITDENEILQAVTIDSTYDFEGSNTETQRVYGIHFDGVLDIRIGENRKLTTASNCFSHSGDNLFLTIRKEACEDVFECQASLTATTNWATEVNICPSDGNSDIVELRNNLFIQPGEHYAYLITDENEILQAVTIDSTYDFEGSSTQTQRVYGIHFNGILDIRIGENRKMTTASECYAHSGDNLFLTINKTECATYECIESLVATANWVTDLGICANDGIDDNILLQNNVNIAPGDTYAFLLTDSEEILLEVVIDSFYNFEGVTSEELRIYGISYGGTLEARIGEHRKNTSATGCYTHSGDNLFIKVNTFGNCNTTSTSDLNAEEFLTIYPNPSQERINIDYTQRDKIEKLLLYNVNGQLINDVTGQTSFEIANTGMYFLRIFTGSDIISQKVVIE